MRPALPGIGRIRKYLSRTYGSLRKRQFSQRLRAEEFVAGLSESAIKATADIELVTFVNAASFQDLTLCIGSFLDSVGKPKRWTLYIDDAFSEMQKSVVANFAFVELRRWDEEFESHVESRYSGKWQLRKFAAYATHPLNGTTIFLDSDVVFYPLFMRYIEDLKTDNWYLPEPANANNIDGEMGALFNFKRRMYTINAGFFIINVPPDWTLGFQYLDHVIREKRDHYFLDQSALNLIYYHDPNARVLDPRVFHASADDQFWISPLKTDTFAIRHYVGLVRHKMWQLGWKRYFPVD